MGITVVNKNGLELNYDITVQFMDSEIREQLHSELSPCTEQEFFTAYETLHEDEFGEEWQLSKSNPVW